MRIFNSVNTVPQLAVVAGVLGSTAALATGTLHIVSTITPLRGEELFGNSVFALLLMMPLAAALWLIRLYAGRRSFIILPAVLLSLALISVSLAGAGIVFVPSIMLLISATLWLTRKERPPKPNGRWILPSLVVTAVVAASFVILFSQHDPRSWQVIHYTGDGTYNIVWNPLTQGDPTMHPWPSSAEFGGSGTISDVISNLEAGESLGLLLAGVGFTILSFIRLESVPGSNLKSGE